MEIVLSILAFCAGIIVSVVAKILLQDRIHFILSRFVGNLVPRKGRHLNGIWKSTYRFPSKGKQKYENQIMRLRHIGPYVVGENLVEQHHKHRLVGRFRNGNYYTGTWDNIAEGELWHGSFQFVLSPDGTRMYGWWLGFDSESVVRSGPWAWKLENRDTGRETLKTYADYANLDNLLEAGLWPDVEKVRTIIDAYIDAWTMQDPEKLDQIFTENAIYHEKAFDRPFMGLHEIKEYWRCKVVASQANIEFNLRELFVDGNTAIAEWEVEFDDLKVGYRKRMREVAIREIEGRKIRSLREYWSSKKI